MGFSKKIALPAILSLSAILLLLAFVLYFRHKEQSRSIVLYGNVDVRQVDIGFRVYGKVNSMPFEEGDFVPKGAFMASIEEQPYADQELKAEAALESARLTLENAKQIFANVVADLHAFAQTYLLFHHPL